MMQFLRKYQRAIFVGITAIIVISFSFFGTFSLNWGSQKAKEIKVAECLDGSPLYYSEIEKMSRFLSSNSDSRSAQERSAPNFFNDGVIEKDFFESKIALLLVSTYFEEMKVHLKNLQERIQRYVPYEHPGAKELSAIEVWKQLAPSIYKGLMEIKKEKEISPQYFFRLAELYFAEKNLPGEMLRRILIYQQNQQPSLPVDMRLLHEDFSLFGLHSIHDWFGQNFVDMISQFILNMAAEAKEKGYKVSEAETLVALKQNLQEELKKWNLKPGQGEFARQLQMIGMHQKDLVELYQKILLFRKYFHDVGSSVFLDTLPYKQLADFASQTALVDFFELPSYLQFKNFREMLLFEVYYQGVFQKGKNPLEVSNTPDSLALVEKRAPELVGKRYQVHLRHTDKNRVVLRIGEKELWDWEMKQNSYQELKKKFFFLPEADSAQKRFQSLEKLAREKRAEVDQFARRKILEEHSSWISETLLTTPQQEVSLDIRAHGSKILLPGLALDKLSLLLEKAPLVGQEKISEEEKKVVEELKFFSNDGENFYSLELIGKDAQKRILSFEEALEDGTLSSMLDSFLESQFADARQKRPDLFGTEPFEAVKDKIATVLFTDLLKAIDEDYQKAHGKISWEKGEGSLEFYAHHRFYYQVRKLRDKIMAQKEISSLIQKEEKQLSEQWKLKEKKIDVDRSFDLPWVCQLLFKKNKVAWSSVHVETTGQISFFHFLEWKPKELPYEEEMLASQKKLSYEAQSYLAKTVLQKIQEKKAIVLPIRKEE